MDRLDTARAYAGRPFIINSAYRTPEYELKHGRTGSSTHCLGRAVDIRCSDSVSRLIIVKSLLRAGFRRIGIAKTFIHVDDDISREKCIWLY